MIPDAYRIRARLSPSLLLAAPLMSVLIGLGFLSLTLGALSCGATTVLAIVLSEQVADMGRELQKTLFTRWGGSPTSQGLRLTNAMDPVVTNARRTAVENATGAPLPTLADEQHDPDEAMGSYDRALDQVRSWLREDDTNKILADVTASYGFRRNCLAVRTYGRLAAVTGTLLATTLWLAAVGSSPTSFLVAAFVNVLLCAFWWVLVSEDWVHRDAERYANQLFQTLLKNNPRHSAPTASGPRLEPPPRALNDENERS